MPRFAVIALSFAAAVVVVTPGCTPTKSPELRVIGFNHTGNTARHEVVFVQVTNPAKRSMRLTKLEYVFAAGNSTVSKGEVTLYREVPAGAAIVVEVPLSADDRLSRAGADQSTGAMTLRGRLTTELDRAVQTFKVFAEIPSSEPIAD